MCVGRTEDRLDVDTDLPLEPWLTHAVLNEYSTDHIVHNWRSGLFLLYFNFIQHIMFDRSINVSSLFDRYIYDVMTSNVTSAI